MVRVATVTEEGAKWSGADSMSATASRAEVAVRRDVKVARLECGNARKLRGWWEERRVKVTGGEYNVVKDIFESLLFSVIVANHKLYLRTLLHAVDTRDGRSIQDKRRNAGFVDDATQVVVHLGLGDAKILMRSGVIPTNARRDDMGEEHLENGGVGSKIVEDGRVLFRPYSTWLSPTLEDDDGETLLQTRDGGGDAGDATANDSYLCHSVVGLGSLDDQSAENGAGIGGEGWNGTGDQLK
ncbi:hypothetical protein FGB62_145g05 [Gracilaria domingensis]|nr:hypothetical protein FGB62_145g05 [Gracilaria domingensis]